MINWFPGHMVKAARHIEQVLRRVDVVIEVRDARLPLSSSSPLLRAALPPHMPVVVALNKSDLANPNLSHRAVQKLGGKDSAVLISSAGSTKGRGIDKLLPTCVRVAKEAPVDRGPLHVVVVGVPNSGKSSLINSLRGSGQAARAGSTPGLTRTLGSFAVAGVGRHGKPVYVIDTPGVLSPARTIGATDGRRLAICGIVKSTAVPDSIVHGWLLGELRQRNWNVDSLTIDAVVKHSGGALDVESAALHVLTQFRNGQLGKITLDEIL